MNKQFQLPGGKFPVFRFTLMLSLLVSILYQLLISYVYGSGSVNDFAENLSITVVEGWIFACVIFFFLKFNDRYGPVSGALRFLMEWPVLIIFGFYFLYLAQGLKDGSLTPLQRLMDTPAYRLYLCVNLVNITFLYIIITVFRMYGQVLEKTLVEEKMKKEYAGLRLQCLKNQVNPHFLFNSLSVLSSLIRKNAAVSEKFIVQLSRAYQYILDHQDEDLISLKAELAFLDAYTFLIQMRFPDKVIIRKHIEAEATAWYIPPLTLQLLVENAVKHNQMSVRNPLEIEVALQGDQLRVTNNLRPRMYAIPSTGIGLENIQTRIGYLTGKPVAFEKSVDFFSVAIPLIKKEKPVIYESAYR